jgi:hypothetical protein
MSAFGTQKIKTLTTLLMLCRARMNRQLQVKPNGSVYLSPLPNFLFSIKYDGVNI